MNYNSDFPLFRHDCLGCSYLGAFQGADLYYCLTRHMLLARVSDDRFFKHHASDTSLPKTKHLVEAQRRARHMRLLPVT